MKLRHLNGKQIDFLRNLRAVGATSAETALTIERNARIAPDDLEELVQVGAITRAAPYRYYLRLDSRHAGLMAAMDSGSGAVEIQQTGTPSPARLVKAIVFWIIVMLIPLVLIQLLGNKR